MFTASLWLPPRHMRLPCWSRPGFTHPPSGAFLIGIRGHEALELHGQPSWWHCSPIWPHRSREAFFGACVLRHFPRPSLKTCPTCPMLSHYLVPSLTTLSPPLRRLHPPLSRSLGAVALGAPRRFLRCAAHPGEPRHAARARSTLTGQPHGPIPARSKQVEAARAGEPGARSVASKTPKGPTSCYSG